MSGIKQLLKSGLRCLLEAMLKAYLAARPVKAFSPEKVERILVFAYHGLGNFIMYTPALKLLRERYPGARIDLQVGNNTGCEEVLDGSGLFDNIYNLPYSEGIRAWVSRVRAMRRARYDLTINEFHSHSWPLALLVAFGGAPYRAGHVTSPGWSERFSRYSFVFNIPVRMKEQEHEIERYLNLVAAAGCRKPALSEARPFIHLTPADKEFADHFFANGFPREGKVIGVQPGTSPTMRWKQWPVERYRELIALVLSSFPETQVVLFGSAVEAGMITEIAEGLSPDISVAAGKTTVKQVAALIGRCDMLVCNDSGLMHVAVAVGTPVVAIYGPTDLSRTAPLGGRHKIVRHEMACSPCFKLEGDAQVHLCPHHDCLMTITPREVLQAVRDSLDNVTPEATGELILISRMGKQR